MAIMRQRSVDASRRLLSDVDLDNGNEGANEKGLRSKRTFGKLWLTVTTILLGASLFAGLVTWTLSSRGDEPCLETVGGNPTIGNSNGYKWTSLLSPQEHVYRQPRTTRLQWRISTGFRRPDGVLKQVYLINDQFPGPTIELRSGDRLIVQVENGLESEGVSIHWHGLSMKGYNRMDGASGVTQAAIAPGETFEYDFEIAAEQHGTFWYHAHNGVQRGDGLYGGLIIHEPRQVTQQEHLPAEHLIMVGDWYHRSAKEALEFYSRPGAFGNEAVPDSILINGRGLYNCSNAVPARPIDCQTTGIDRGALLSLEDTSSMLRVINVGSYAGFDMTISDAYLTPVTVDGGNGVQQQTANSIGVLHPGERVDLMVDRMSKDDGQKSLTIALDTTFFKYSNPALTTVHHFPIPMSNSKGKPRRPATVIQRLDLTTLRAPESNIFIPEPDQTIVLYAITQKLSHLDNQPFGFINCTHWAPQSSQASPLVDLARSQWDKNLFIPQIHSRVDRSTIVDIVLNNLDEEGHPFHLHGYDFWVLSTFSSEHNWGSYNPFEDAIKPGGEYDLVTALRKDTVYVPRRGYAILRFRADNPGIWMFHCHVLWHQASGMAMAFEVVGDP